MDRLNVEISWGSLWRVLIILGFVAVLYWARNAAIVLLLAIFLSSALDALVIRMEGWKIPRLLGTILVFLGVLLTFAVIIYTVIPLAIIELSSLLNNISGAIGDFLKLGIPSQLTHIVTDNLEAISNTLLAGGASFITILSKLLGGVTSFIAVMITSFYLTLSRDGVGRFIRAIFPEELEDQVLSVYYRSKKKIGRWFQAQVMLGTVIGFLVFIGLWALGIKYKLLLAILAAIFEIVPIVGPIFAGAIAVMVGLSQSFASGLYVLILFLIIQQLENNVLVPLVMRRAIGIHPVIILIALLAGFETAGFVGMILAVPVAVVAGEVVENWVQKKARSRRKLTI